jgi:hypothetical protein
VRLAPAHYILKYKPSAQLRSATNSIYAEDRSLWNITLISY